MHLPLRYCLGMIGLLWVALLSGCQTASPIVRSTAVPNLNTPTPTQPAPTVSPVPTVTEIATMTAVPLPTVTSPAVPTPAPTATVEVPTFSNPLNLTIPQEVPEAVFVQVTSQNSGYWAFDSPLLTHPIAVEAAHGQLFMLDGGRLLMFDILEPGKQQLLLQPDDRVENVPVLELLDLVATTEGLLLLDRAGDVYRYNFANQSWSLDWYGREIGETSGHYYTALGGDEQNRLLLESSYHFVQRYGAQPRIWHLPEEIGVDIVEAEMTYVLQQGLQTDEGVIRRYQETVWDRAFEPEIALRQVRQLRVTQTAVYVLDWAGERLVEMDKEGKVIRIFQTPPNTTTFWVKGNEEIVFAGADGVVWWNQLERNAFVPSEVPLSHQPITQTHLQPDSLQLPIVGTNLTERPLQMPGAPRHYRLGIHQGLDFYWRTGTPVYAVADGVVVSATLGYERPSQGQFNYWWRTSHEAGKTTDKGLEFYRGMQLWVEHEDGMISRYAHLSEIHWQIEVGTVVTQGQQLGKVGNSGSPASVNSQNRDAHLHFELWAEECYLGQYLRPVETWELIKYMFQDKESS